MTKKTNKKKHKTIFLIVKDDFNNDIEIYCYTKDFFIAMDRLKGFSK